MKYFLMSFYLLVLVFVVWISYFFVDPNLSYLEWFYLNLKLSSQSEKIVILFLILFTLFIFYGLILLAYSYTKIHKKDCVILICISGLVLLFAYPAVYSYDIFNYIATAKVAFYYRENPYVLMPIEFSGDPMLAFMHAPNKVALYGPAWILITFIPFIAGAGNFLLTVFAFKAVVVAFYFFLLYLMYKISKNFSAVLFFGLNPLVLIEVLWSGHNDVVMIAMLLLAFYFYFHKRYVSSVLCSIFSFLIKYATAILIPILLYLRYKHAQKAITQHQVLRGLMFGMLVIFLLSAFREEIYPWYAVWFLPFVAMSGTKREKILAVIFTFCLELRYFPYMLTLTHFGMTPALKTIVTFGPILFFASALYYKPLWEKISFRLSR